MPHIGYDVDGKKVMRPATGDELDKFLEGVEDADGGWFVAFVFFWIKGYADHFLQTGRPLRIDCIIKTSL